MNLSFLIPTYKRPEDIMQCLMSLAPQLISGDEVFVLDDDSLDRVVQDALATLIQGAGGVFYYVHKSQAGIPAGSSHSRNYGIDNAKHEYLCIFDDDIILESGFIDRVRLLWSQHAHDDTTVALGGVITNNRKIQRVEKIFHDFFGLSSDCDWDVNNNGFQVWNDHIAEITEGYYLHGGLASYRVSYLKDGHMFAQGVDGRAALEDVIFSLDAKQLGKKFLIDPAMKAYHAHSSSGREHAFVTGVKETKNRLALKKILKKYHVYQPLSFYWALKGWIVRQFLAGHFLKGFGMIRGFLW